MTPMPIGDEYSTSAMRQKLRKVDFEVGEQTLKEGGS